MAREVLSVADLSRQLQPLGVPEILREALKIHRKNGRLMASIFLLLLAPSSILVWAHDRAVLPLVDDDSDDGEDFAGRRAPGRLLLLESLFFLAFGAVSLSAMALTVYASSMAYTGSCLITLKDAVLRTLAAWKRPMKTCLCVAVITVAYASLLLMLLGGLSLVATGDALTASVVVLGSCAVLFYAFFLAVVWMLGFAVSVMEDDCCGMDALARAAKLIRGRRKDGFLLMLLMLLLGAPIYMLLYLNTREDDQGAPARVAVGVAATALACLLEIFTFMAFTVFYHECRRYHGEKVEGGAGYGLLPTTVHAANPLPRCMYI